MADIKIALTNLGKYNEGTLDYVWLELPADEDEIQEAFEAVGVAPNTEYEEHFISDYEAPFHVSEYESITKLNEIAEQIEDVEIPEPSGYFIKSYEVTDVMDFAVELENENIVPGATEYIGDIVDTDTIDEMVKHEAESGGWQRVLFFLNGIESIRDGFYRINGYGNLEDITPSYLEAVMDDLMDDMKRELA